MYLNIRMVILFHHFTNNNIKVKVKLMDSKSVVIIKNLSQEKKNLTTN